MGFYVPTNRDVKFPKACEQCHFYDGLLCCVMDTYVHDPENKHEECPLIEIPDNHGRLIDADDFIKRMTELMQKAEEDDFALGAAWYETFIRHIELSPEIIPKDEVV